jgi:DNA ligase-1
VKRFAAALDLVRASRSRTAKERALGDAFVVIAADGDLALATAARLASGRTLPVGDGRALGVGSSLMGELAIEVTGFDADVVRACARRAGDLGEAFGLLVARADGAARRVGVSLDDVAHAFDALASASGRAEKLAVLRPLYARMSPLETKYLTKSLLSTLRIGAQGGVVEGAISRAFERELEDVRRALAVTGDVGIVAVLARDDRLGSAAFSIGRPIAYMLATPLESIASPIDAALVAVEDKIDGIRAQVHKSGSEVTIFARGLERVTSAFPEVRDAFRLVVGDVALDGELVALTPSGRPRPFQALQPRLNRATPTRAMLDAIPVTFVAYDLLADADGPHFALPWTERRRKLEAFARARGPAASFALNAYAPLDGASPIEAALDAAYAAARGRGHEGVVLKRTDAPYEAGRRGSAWIKVKRALATLDVVVTAVEEGNGKRAGMLSDYTFAVWCGDELVNVGKAYSGLTDAEITMLQARFERATVERHGRVRLVKPEIVLEVGFDGIQRSRRHKSGFALRFPRIHRIRDDKRADDADDVAAVEAIFALQVESGHREEALEPISPTPPPRKAKRVVRTKNVDDLQLGLFADAPKRG